MQTKVAEPSQVIGSTDKVDNDVQPNNAATFDDQGEDMNDAGFDEH